MKILFLWVTLLCATLLGAQALSPQEYQNLLRTGINVNWAMWKKEIKHFSPKTVRDFKEIGFNHIRIRFHNRYEKLGMSKEEYFSHIDKIVKLTLQEGMIPILAFEGAKLKEQPTKGNLQKAVALWRFVARRYRNASQLLSFDLMIEPAKAISRHPKLLNRYYKKAVRAIRATNPYRIIFIAPPKLAQPSSLKELRIPRKAGKYLMIETHFYAAGPSPTNPKKLWTTGTKEEKRLFRSYFQEALRWQKRTRIPIWIGAIMPGDYNHGDHYTIKQQVAFATFFSRLFRKHRIPFAINADQQFYDYVNHRWRKDRIEVVKAILNPYP
jgi:hypothetical protein